MVSPALLNPPSTRIIWGRRQLPIPHVVPTNGVLPAVYQSISNCGIGSNFIRSGAQRALRSRFGCTKLSDWRSFLSGVGCWHLVERPLVLWRRSGSFGGGVQCNLTVPHRSEIVTDQLRQPTELETGPPRGLQGRSSSRILRDHRFDRPPSTRLRRTDKCALGRNSRTD
jgi:hypothetical protein